MTTPRLFPPNLFVFAAALLALACSSATAATARPPNIIVILTDDQGTLDVGCYGAKDLETPHLDALARRGLRFTQFYAASAVCSPSRAGLLTGRYPINAGLTGNASSQAGGEGLAPEQITIAEHFKAAGYATGHFGKWHLGYRPETMPLGQGFDVSFGHMGGCIDNYSHFFYWQGPNRHDLHRAGREVFEDGKFFPDLMVREVATFMEQNRAKPFFIYFAMNLPHYPYQPDEKWLRRYESLPYPRNLYAAFVSTMDERIGALVKHVELLGLLDDTIIVFQSDHGHSTEERAHSGGGWAGAYRGAKFSLFEGGIRVPALISWPARLPKGEIRDQIAHSCDWLPTVAELAGVTLQGPALDGKSLVRVLKSSTAPTPHEALHWFMGPNNNPQWAVRHGDWKLIGNVRDTTGGALTDDDKKLFLANLSDDPSEQTNLAPREPATVQRLSAIHERIISERR